MGRPSCWLARFDSDVPCDGYLQAAHLISKQRIKRFAPLALLWDPRVLVVACERHHRRLDESRRLRVPRAELPPGAEEFAREHGLERFLEREYGEVAA